MARIISRPQGLDFDTPGRRDYYAALEHDSLWGDHLIPLTVIVGPKAQPGQGLVVFGANHGNEYEGPVVIRHLLSQIDSDAVLGRIILVPILNPGAFKAGTREATLDDRVNLNRAFIAGAGKLPGISGITHRIADFVRAYIWDQAHVVIDLHSGGMVARFAQCASYHPLDDHEQSCVIENSARWFGTPAVMIYQNQTPGLLPSEAERLGKITIGTELGWGNAVMQEGVRWGLHGVRAAAIHHGQMKGKIAPIDHHLDGTQIKCEIVDRECYTSAPFAGHFEPRVQCGARVKKGDIIGLLHDFDRIDLDPWPVRAGVTGALLTQAWQAPVLQGQHIAVTGQIRPWLKSKRAR